MFDDVAIATNEEQSRKRGEVGEGLRSIIVHKGTKKTHSVISLRVRLL